VSSVLATGNFAEIDAIAANYAAGGGQPGLAYGIVIDGELVHAAGVGERVLDGPVPDADTVFRIASMSKSFTAAATLSLRDEGALALDDLAAEYVPELRGWAPASPDADPVSIRHLLTMTAGFPTDDPWGDRQQGLPLDEFATLLSGGVSFAWAPGTRFEYSNLGYAILGRVISAAAGRPYDEVIRERLLRPLGMASTGFAAGEFESARLARGYRRVRASTEPGEPAELAELAEPGAPGPAPDPAGPVRADAARKDAAWEEVPLDPYGAFAPMGGIFSTVRDLARWVAGFAAAFPPGDQTPGAHPLGRASRREMQLPRVATDWARARAASYGYGLFVESDPRWGRIVSHSGGYPGFGSNMRWHPATGTGVIALANGTYAPMTALATVLLDRVLSNRRVPAVPLAPGQEPWPATIEAQRAVNELLRSWDDAAAEALFSENVRLDAPYAERRRALALVRERIGDFTPDAALGEESDTPAHRRWWLTGERGTVLVQIQLTPERRPRVQSLMLAVPPASGSPLSRAIDHLVAWMNGGVPEWPGSVPVARDMNVGVAARRLRMTAVWAGELSTRGWRAGDGDCAATVELTGTHATAHLLVAVDPATGAVRQADATLVP
jgi:CubicO group peptidase (beta-lactamase class C family)